MFIGLARDRQHQATLESQRWLKVEGAELSPLKDGDSLDDSRHSRTALLSTFEDYHNVPSLWP